MTTHQPDAGAVATWGQFAMDVNIRRAHAIPGFFNLGSLIALPTAVTDLELADALRSCAAVLSILRTDFEGTGYDLRQRVVRTDDLHIEVGRLAVADARAAEQAHAALRARHFTPGSGPPWQATAIVTSDGDLFLSFVISHMLTDDHGWLILRDNIVRAISGREVETPAWTALDEAAFESSPAGRQTNRRNLRRIGRILHEAPSCTVPTGRAEPTRFHVGKLISPDMEESVAGIARRWEVSESAVLLSAFTSAMAQLLDSDAVVVNLLSGNRFYARTSRLIANMARDTLAHLRVRPGFGPQTTGVYAAAIDAYRHASYHPLDAYAMYADVLPDGPRRHLVTGIHFNDGRRRAGSAGHPGGLDGRPRRDLNLSPEPLAYYDALAVLHVRNLRDSRHYQLELVADTAFVETGRMLSLLEGMEANLIGSHTTDRLTGPGRGNR